MIRTWIMVALALLLGTCGYRPSSPLARAVLDGDTATVEALLARGPPRGDLQEALIAAARFGRPEMILELKAAGAGLEEAAGVNGWSPLKHAIHKNQPASVQALLAAGADPNAATGGMGTPLMMAAGYGFVPIVRVLLGHGADARRTDGAGHNALDAALRGTSDIDRFTLGHCQTETVRLLLESTPDLRHTERIPGCAEIERLLRPTASAESR